MAADVQSKIAELDSILTDASGQRNRMTFASLKRQSDVPPFDPGGLDHPCVEPQWARFALPPPSGLGRMFGGGARRQREEVAARQAYEIEHSRYTRAEMDRRRRLNERRRAYDQYVGETAETVRRHNKSIDELERAFKYVQSRDEIDTVKRAEKEIKDRYGRLIAQVALRTLHEVFTGDPVGLIEVATFNGHVSTKDKATGRPVRPCLISVSAPRELFSTFVLADLDPVVCLRELNALVSAHPYDLEAVRPVVDFEARLSQYKFVEGMDAVAGLDSRPDLLDMTPTEFEHLVRQLFESMGMKSWDGTSSSACPNRRPSAAEPRQEPRPSRHGARRSR